MGQEFPSVEMNYCRVTWSFLPLLAAEAFLMWASMLAKGDSFTPLVGARKSELVCSQEDITKPGTWELGVI
jgi:hypothetical protein